MDIEVPLASHQVEDLLVRQGGRTVQNPMGEIRGQVRPSN
jgi:hypothetical protein